MAKPKKEPVKGPKPKKLYKSIPDMAARLIPTRAAAPVVDLTPEQTAHIACSQLAQTLLGKPDIAQAVQVMIALRRSYAVVHRELGEACDAVREAAEAKGEKWAPEVLDFLIQFAGYQASMPFSEHTLMNQFPSDVLPWLARTVDKHSDVDDANHRDDVAEAEKERRSKPVDIGVVYTANEPAELRRGDKDDAGWKGLVLVGWKPAVLWLIDKMVKHAGPEIRLSRILASEAHAHAGCCDSRKKFEKVLSMLPVNPPGPCDLLVCDDLGTAYTQGYIGRPTAPRAGDAYRQFYKLCRMTGSAFIGGVLLPTQGPVDVDGPEFEQLRTHSHLRLVTVEQADGDSYKVTVGNHASEFTPHATELEPPPKVLVAGGQIGA